MTTDPLKTIISESSEWTTRIFSYFSPRDKEDLNGITTYWGMFEVFNKSISIPLFSERFSSNCKVSPEECFHCIAFIAELESQLNRSLNKNFFLEFVSQLYYIFVGFFGVLHFRAAYFRSRQKRIGLFLGSLAKSSALSDFRYSNIIDSLDGKFSVIRVIRPRSKFMNPRILIKSHCLSTSIVFWPRSKGGNFDGEWDCSKNIPSILHSVLNSLYRKPNIGILKFLIKMSGIEAFFVLYFSARTFMLFPIMKQLSIFSIGMQHAAGLPSYNVFEYLRNPHSTINIGPDLFGAWTPWWKEKLENTLGLYGRIEVSGPMRKSGTNSTLDVEEHEQTKILWIDEQLADYDKVLPFFLKLYATFSIDVKVRSKIQTFLFDELKTNGDHDVDVAAIAQIESGLHEINNQNYIVVGTYSSAALELASRGFLTIFIKTPKWGDYYELSGKYDNVLVTSDINQMLNFINSKRSNWNKANDLDELFFGGREYNPEWVSDCLTDYFGLEGK